ncbi:hypothetical protein [Foetidibacter luteolus]|uniref:hypothetical protein n=1 Tax=Foetidibacter luteolus TaxID=2608880 RepID=UPI00129A45B4|nr:hypothetical protein [Foetidibacter luteolus]
MELDELKLHLKQKLETAPPAKSQDEITALLKKDTLSVLGKLKRSLLFEIVFAVIFIIVCVVLAFKSGYWSMRVYFGVFTVVLIPFFVVLIYLLKKLNRVSSHPMPVKENIITLYGLLREFVKRYFQFTMSLLPLCFALAFWAGYNEPDKSIEDKGIKFGSNAGLIAFMVAYISALGIGMYYFTKWYLNKLYGKYLRQLEGLIKELDDQ